MAVKKFKPTTPGRRQMSVASFDEVTTTKPEKSLLKSLNKHSGRNNSGKITVRHRGGGNKRKATAARMKNMRFSDMTSAARTRG